MFIKLKDGEYNMTSELKLFLDDIKPAILISKKQYKSNEDKLKSFNIKQQGRDYLIYRDGVDLTQPLGVILGYHPESVKLFSDNNFAKRTDIIQKVIKSNFINYNGIHFNCYDKFNEALEWCNKTYGKKMIEKYGKIDVKKISSTFELEVDNDNIGYVVVDSKIETITYGNV